VVVAEVVAAGVARAERPLAVVVVVVEVEVEVAGAVTSKETAEVAAEATFMVIAEVVAAVTFKAIGAEGAEATSRPIAAVVDFGETVVVGMVVPAAMSISKWAENMFPIYLNVLM
jgi:hypothetical protein